MAISWSDLSDNAKKAWITKVFPTYRDSHKNPDDIPTIIEAAVNYGTEHGVDPDLILSVVKSESDFGKLSIDNVAQVTDIALEDLAALGYEVPDVSTISGSVEAAALFLKVTENRLEKKLGYKPSVSEIGTAYFTGVTKFSEEGFTEDTLYDQTSGLERGRKIDEYYQKIQGSGEYKPNLETVGGRQELLRIYGAYENVIDGVEGEGTKKAYETFQADNGLPITGIYDPMTAGKLQSYSEKSYTSPSYADFIDNWVEPEVFKEDTVPQVIDLEVPMDLDVTPSAAEYNEVIQQQAIYDKVSQSAVEQSIDAGIYHFMDGLSGGWLSKMAQDNALTPIHGEGLSFVNNVSEIAGQLTNMVGLVSVSGAVVQGLKGAKYLGTALKVMDKFTLNGVSGALQGTIYTGLDWLTSPDNLKPDMGDLGINALQFGVGDMARTFVGSVLGKFNVNPVATELVSYVADTLAGAGAAWGITQDDAQFMAEIGPQAIAIGIVDVMATMVAHKKVSVMAGPTLKDAQMKLQTYLDTPTKGNLEAVYDSINDFTQFVMPGNFTDMPKLLNDLDTKLTDDFNVALKEAGDAKIAESKVEPETPKVEPETPKVEPKVDLEAPKVDTQRIERPLEDIEDVVKVEDIEVPVDGVSRETRIEPSKPTEPPKEDLVRPIENSKGEIVKVEFDNPIDAAMYDLADKLTKDIQDYQKIKGIEDLKKAMGIPEDVPIEDILTEFKNYVDTKAETGKLDPMIPKNLEDIKYLQRVQIDFGKTEGKSDTVNNVVTQDIPKELPSQPEKITPWQEIQKKILDRVDVNLLEQIKLSKVYKPTDGYSINTTRYGNTDAKVLADLKDIADFAKESKGKTLEGIKADSKKFVEDMGLQDEIKTINKLLNEAPEKLTAFRQIVLDNGEAIRSLVTRIQDKKAAGITPSDLELAQFLYLTDLQKSLTTDLTNLQTNVSQTLNAGRIIIEGSSPKMLTDMTFDEYVKSTDARATVQTIKDNMDIDDVMKLIDNFDISSMYGINKSSKKAENKWLKAAMTFRTANLLSINTAMKNIVGQTANMLFESVTDYAAAITGLIPRAFGKGTGITLREANKRLVGTLSGFFEAITKPKVTVKDITRINHGGKAMSTFDVLMLRLLDPVSYMENLKATALVGTRAGAEGFKNVLTSDYLRGSNPGEKPMIDTVWKVFDFYAGHKQALSFGLLESGDRPFAQSAWHAEVMGRIADMEATGAIKPKAASELFKKVQDYNSMKLLEPVINDYINRYGLTPEEASKFTNKAYEDIIGSDPRKLLEDPMIADIVNLDNMGKAHAADMTWKSEINSKTVKEIEALINRVPALKLIMPFFHTPAKIMGKFIGSTPLALASKDFRADISGKNGRRAQDMATGKLAGTALLMGIGGALYSQGMLTGTARNADERRRMNEAGIPENSIRFGDTWISYNSIDPAPGMYFAAMYEIARVFEEADNPLAPENLDLWGSAAFGIMKNMLSDTYMRGLREAMEAINDPDKAQAWIESQVGSFDPLRNPKGYLKNSEFFGLNPAYTDYLEDTWNDLKAGTPRLDSFGKPKVKYKRTFGMFTSEQTQSPIRQELVKLGYSLESLVNSVNNVKLPDQMYHDMLRSMDTQFDVEGRLNDLVTSTSYKMLSAQQKTEAIKNTYTKVKQAARNKVMRTPEYRQLYKEYIQEQQEKQRDPDYKYNFFNDQESWINKILNFGGD